MERVFIPTAALPFDVTTSRATANGDVQSQSMSHDIVGRVSKWTPWLWRVNDSINCWSAFNALVIDAFFVVATLGSRSTHLTKIADSAMFALVAHKDELPSSSW